MGENEALQNYWAGWLVLKEGGMRRSRLVAYHKKGDLEGAETKKNSLNVLKVSNESRFEIPMNSQQFVSVSS